MRMTVVLSLVASAAVQVAAGDFSATCSGTSYFSTSITSFCDSADQESTEKTDIDLKKCLANVGGRLVFCDCGLAGDKKTLNCRCTDASGTKKPTSINLDTCLSNIDATLTC
ncbi:hypothetical protein CI238_00749 [Colletotrichum incanum]|uniref:Uncharacterized protein n=1 Tax=Colletotrichum incanum TaxID=1573173 RepID=A0A161WFP1_COLIC|nr:hypothetical protein CI238_00749 [Colletotrichum incanum]OHW89442.1 cyanovirin-n domain-containing protein [Colletotrichum incanum]